MLKILRQKEVAKKITWVIAIIIIISFGFLGTAYLLTDSNPSSIKHAGKIFGKKIKIETFQETYQQVQLQALLQYGNNFRQILPHLDLDGQTWDRLILLHAADKAGIAVSDQEVVSIIDNMEIFQRNGEFDASLYNQIVKSALGIEPRFFEESMRDSLKISKLHDTVTDDISISEDEIRSLFQEQNTQAKIAYSVVSPETFLSEVSVSDEAMEKFYRDNPDLFRQEAADKARFVVIPFKNEEDKDAVRARGEEVFEDLLINPNMEEVAGKHNLPVQSTDFFTRQKPDPSLGWPLDLWSRLSQLGPNEISDPFETDEGILIAQISETREPTLPPLDNIRSEVESHFRHSRAEEMAFEKAAAIAGELQSNAPASSDGFQAEMEQRGLEVKNTPLFHRGDYIDEIGMIPAFQDAVFALTEEKPVSGPIPTSKGPAIAYLVEKQSANLEKLAEQRQALSEQLLTDKESDHFNQYLSKLRIDAKLEDNIPLLREEQGSF